MNIAVFLPNWIGDAVMATPALRALRQHFAGAHVTAVLRTYVAGVLEGGVWVDEQIHTGRRSWSQSVPAVAWQLRRRRIDLAVLFPNSFRSALSAWLGGCKRRIGYARSQRTLLLTDGLPTVYTPNPIIDAYNLLVERAGCPDPGHRMELFTTARDEAAADEVWERTGLSRVSEVVCLNPGAAFGAAKHWPSAHCSALARNLVRERGCGILVLCGPSERELCREIVTGAAHPLVHGLADFPLSLGLTKACVRRCDLLVTTDSGPRHFAAAFGRPVVSLFGPTHIAWTETYFPRALHVQKQLPCGPCQQRVCPLKHHRCMTELGPDEVLAATRRLLSSQPEQGEQRSSA